MVRRIFFFILTLVFTSCATKKDIYYFQNIDSKTISNKFDYLSIQPGDILDIQIKALNPESVAIFQPQPVNNQNQSERFCSIDSLHSHLFSFFIIIADK